MPEWLIPVFVGLAILALFGLAHWYFEVYTVRKHWREAHAEADAIMRAYGPRHRPRQGGNINPPPTYARPPAPPGPPPMADTTYGCATHYYGGKCPNCQRTSGVAVPLNDQSKDPK